MEDHVTARNRKAKDDISGLKTTRGALFARERPYRDLFENAPVPIVEVDVSGVKAHIQGLLDGGVRDLQTYFDDQPEALVETADLIKVLEVNASALDFLAFASKEDLLQHWTTSIFPELGGLVQDGFAAFAGGNSTFEREATIQTPAGEFKHLILRMSRLPADEPTVTRLVISAVDVSERRRLEGELRNVDRAAAVGQAALMIGHDLRNPLQVIANEVYLASNGLRALPESLGDEAIRNELLQSCLTIRQQLGYVNRIVSDLQDSARDLQLHCANVDVVKLISDALSTISVPKNVVVEVSVSRRASTFTGDPEMLRRLLINLTVNALQAMPTGGRLTISAHASKGAIELGVQDTGSGLKWEPNTIFEPFYTTKARGVGLGLTICKRIAAAHGGSIDVASTPGSGARFTVRLPITEARYT